MPSGYALTLTSFISTTTSSLEQTIPAFIRMLEGRSFGKSVVNSTVTGSGVVNNTGSPGPSQGVFFNVPKAVSQGVELETTDFELGAGGGRHLAAPEVREDQREERRAQRISLLHPLRGAQ